VEQSLGGIDLHLHFTPLAVPGQVLGPVANHILVAQLGGNLLRNVTISSIFVHPEEPAAGLFAQIVQELRTGALLGRCGVGVEYPDRVNLNIGLAHLRADLNPRIAGAVVAAVETTSSALRSCLASRIFSTP